MEQKVTVSKLASSDQNVILKIARWHFNEWNTPIEKTIHRLTGQPDRDTLFQLILAIEHNIVATGGLCNDVNLFRAHEKFKQFKPWIGLLYTQKEYRGRGFGTMLLDQIERCAKEEGLTKIYLYTFTAESLYRRCGWIEIDRVMYKGHDTAVMEKTL